MEDNRMDDIIGTWKVQSMENVDEVGPAFGFTTEMIRTTYCVGTTMTYAKMGDNKYKFVWVPAKGCDKTDVDFVLKKPSPFKMCFNDGKVIENQATLMYCGNGVWKMTSMNKGSTLEETFTVSGDTVNLTTTCQGVTGKVVFKKV